jgi:hypothetical protein
LQLIGLWLTFDDTQLRERTHPGVSWHLIVVGLTFGEGGSKALEFAASGARRMK